MAPGFNYSKCFFLPVHRAVCWASISCLEVLRIANRPNLGKKVRIRKKKMELARPGDSHYFVRVSYIYILSVFFRSNACMCDPSLVCLSMSFFCFLHLSLDFCLWEPLTPLNLPGECGSPRTCLKNLRK